MHDQAFPADSTEARVVDALKACYDPEIPVNIYEMGLIYRVEVGEDRMVSVDMTLTSPACPVAQSLPIEVQDRIEAMVPDISGARVEVVWDPPWNMDMMSEAAKLELGMM